jgi:hypothetical protein
VLCYPSGEDTEGAIRMARKSQASQVSASMRLKIQQKPGESSANKLNVARFKYPIRVSSFASWESRPY